MDCAEEVAVLKRELGPLVTSEDNLRFDLLQGRLIVVSDEPAGTIRAAIGKTGMRAVPWEDHVRESRSESVVGYWTTHGREVMCIASGVCLIAAFVAQIANLGLRVAVIQTDVDGYSAVTTFLLAVATLTGAWYVIPKAWYALRSLRPDINLLMVVAITGAIILGEWFEAAMVSFLFSLALLLESWSVGRARRAISSLMDMAPDTARYRPTGEIATEFHEGPVGEVPVGSTVSVLPGERVPLDGVVTRGATSINQAPITGESVPVPKSEGDEVYAGTINNEGSLEFRSTKAAEDSSLARIIRMVEEAQSRRAPAEQWVERFARYYTPAMMILAVLVAVVPPLLGLTAWGVSVYQALVLLVIACPCALVISTPVSIVAGLTRAARAGVLIKGGAYLEMPAQLKAIAMDKTGTLTLGEPRVQRVIPLNGHSAEELLSMAAGIESLSRHPVAEAVVRHARDEQVAFSPAESYHAIEGKGAEARIGDRVYWIGSHRLLRERGHDDDTANEHATAIEDAGHTVVMLGTEAHICGLIAVADEVRAESRDAVDALKRAGVEHIIMITGDNERTARELAAAVGVDEFYAEQLPQDKVARLREIVDRHGATAMVGDGVNDAPAMAASSLAIAMGAAGSDAAIETADVALMSDDLSKVPWLVEHSRRTVRIIRQNVVIALGLKVVVFALALAGWATLWLAILADMGASLIVIFNGLRLLSTRE
ncbi:MAG: cadmium-translocating P-type ATPase [Candidatus Hydrogenedentes bacterium]|nr:cadmium-translocating P-type ATPase [Candidatus Hydrogenedentota bacterium]